MAVYYLYFYVFKKLRNIAFAEAKSSLQLSLHNGE